MPRIVIRVGEDYIDELKARLAKYGITHGQLAREMGLKTPQVSRWINKRAQPRIDNVQKIEAAILAIRKRQGWRVPPRSEPAT